MAVGLVVVLAFDDSTGDDDAFHGWCFLMDTAVVHFLVVDYIFFDIIIVAIVHWLVCAHAIACL